MAEATFVINGDLTKQFHAKTGMTDIVIGGARDDTMFHVDFIAKQGDKIINFRGYKHVDDKKLGIKDNLEIKRDNNLAEHRLIGVTGLLAEVRKELFNRTGCRLPTILAIGPLDKRGDLTFWKKRQAIRFSPQKGTVHKFIGFQLSEEIPGTPLNKLVEEQKNPEFLRKVGEQLGEIIAEFQELAKYVSLKRNNTPETLARDHGYRYAVEKTQQAADQGGKYGGLAKMLHADLAPRFASEEERDYSIHGNLALEGVSVDASDPNNPKVVALTNLTYARRGPATSDHRALATLPRAFNAAARSYERTSSRLQRRRVIFDRAESLKLAGTMHLNSIIGNQKLRTAPIDPKNPKAGQIAQEMVAASIVFTQVAKSDPKYRDYAKLLQQDARDFIRGYQKKGINLKHHLR